MTAKEIVLDLYKSDVLLNKSEVAELLHPDIIIEWNSSKGFVQMKFDDILKLSEELSKAYIRSKMRITHIIEEDNMVSARYNHFVKTI